MKNDALAEELRQLRDSRGGASDGINALAEGFEKLSKAANSGQIKEIGEAFSAKEIKDYAKGLGDVRRNVRYLQQEYRRFGEEVRRVHEELDDAAKLAGRMGGRGGRGGGGGVGGSGGRRGSGGGGDSKESSLLKDYLEKNKRDAKALRSRAVSAVALSGMAGYALSRIKQGVQIRINEEAATLQTEGGLGIGRSRAARRTAFRGIGLGLSPAQAYPFLLQTGRAVGRFDPRGAYSNMLLSQGRNLGMGDLTGLQQASRFAGDKALGKAINDTLINAFKTSGANPALLEEFLRGSTKVLQGMAPGSTAASARDATGLLAAMSKHLGGVYQRSPERTAGLLSRFGAGIQPGGDDAMQSFKLRAVGFGSGRGYWDSIAQLEKGGTAANIQAFIQQIKKEYAGMGIKMQAGALYRLMGGQLKYHESLRLLQTGGAGLVDDASLASKGAGVPEGKLRRHIAGRKGDTIRELGRQRAMAKLTGSPGAQTILTGQAWLDKIGMKTINLILDPFNEGKKAVTDFANEVNKAARAIHNAMIRYRVPGAKAEDISDDGSRGDKPRTGRNKKVAKKK